MDLKTLALLDPNISYFLQVKDAIGAALLQEEQLFISEHYPKLVNFLHSDYGKKAIQEFVLAWQTEPNK